MSEQRLLNYFRTRIQVPTESMFEHPDEYCFYCLPRDGIDALSRIIGYLEREVTYVTEPIDSISYLGPTGEELDAIKDLMAETEDSIMSPCDFTDILAVLNRNADAIEALQCICASLGSGQSASVFGDDLPALLSTNEVFPGTSMPVATYGPQVDDDACAIAQLYYAFVFEMMTEIVLPAANATFDNLLPALAGLIAGIIGTPVVGLAMYAIAEMVQELLELGYVVAEQNYVNWLLSVKQEWICSAYGQLVVGATSTQIAQKIDDDIISASGTISTGDKIVTRLIGGTLAVVQAEIAYGNVTSWAIENVDAGFCSECVIVPDGCVDFGACNLADWSGGFMECVNGAAVNKGGLSEWTKQVGTPGVEGYFVVGWFPRSSGGVSASANFGLTLVSNDMHFNIITEVLLPVNELAIAYAPVPAGLWLNDVRFDVQQVVNWAEPVYWCFQQDPPV